MKNFIIMHYFGLNLIDLVFLYVFVICSQFIVGEDGTCGLVYEHAPAEGPPIVFLIDYVVKYM